MAVQVIYQMIVILNNCQLLVGFMLNHLMKEISSKRENLFYK
jgi:hypothetical protein